jgi:hypothetical protein
MVIIQPLSDILELVGQLDDSPIPIDFDVRARLIAFKDKDPDRHSAWFVQATRGIDKKDFEVLTCQEVKG